MLVDEISDKKIIPYIDDGRFEDTPLSEMMLNINKDKSIKKQLTLKKLDKLLEQQTKSSEDSYIVD